MADDRLEQSHIDFTFPDAGSRTSTNPRGISSSMNPRSFRERNRGAEADSAPVLEAHDHPRDVVDTSWDIPFIEFPARPGVEPDSNRPNARNHQTSMRTRFASRSLQTITDANQLTDGTGQTLIDDDTHHDRLLDPWDVSDDHSSTDGDPNTSVYGVSQHDAGVPADVHRADAFERVVRPGFAGDNEDSGRTTLPWRHVSRSLRFSHSRVLLVGIAAVVCVGLFASWLLWQRHEETVQIQIASSRCTDAVTRYSAVDNALKQVLSQTSSQQRVTTSQVSDQQVVLNLRKAVDKAQASRLSAGQQRCGVRLGMALNERHAALANAAATMVTRLTKEVRSRAVEVTASSTTYQSALSEARNQLTVVIENARTILNESLYQVEDNTTRVSLESTIDSAKTLLAQQSASLASIRENTNDVRQAQNEVTASMNEYAAQQRVGSQENSVSGVQTQQQTEKNANAQVGSNANTQTNTTSGTGNQSSSPSQSE